VNQKNILFISSWYPNEEDPTLGIFVRRHAIAASKYNNVRVLIARSDDHISDVKIEEFETNGIQEIIITYPKIKFTLPLISTYIKFKKLLDIYDQGLDHLIKKGFSPEIIHCNVMDPVGVIGLNWKNKRDLPYVITEHWTGYTDLDGRYEKSRKLKFFIPTMANKAEWVLPVSTDLEKALIEKGLGRKHKVIRNVVDTEKFVFSPSIPDQFMVIADLENDQKNISGIIQAFHTFSKANPIIKLTIAGGGNDETEIRSEIKNLGLKDRVNLIGRVPADVLSEHLNQSFGLILFSNYENLPCVIVESFACGVPVISTDVGGISEIINTENGVLIKQKDQKALIEAMSFIIQNNWDKNSIRQFAIDNFSLDEIGKEFDDIYRSI
jgi:glycosyltransferase involved in cell wall biosynthesis